MTTRRQNSFYIEGVNLKQENNDLRDEGLLSKGTQPGGYCRGIRNKELKCPPTGDAEPRHHKGWQVDSWHFPSTLKGWVGEKGLGGLPCIECTAPHSEALGWEMPIKT